MYHDRIDFTVGAEALTAIDGGLTAVEANTDAFLVSLPPEEIKRLAKIGLKTETFAYKALELGKLNIDLLPRNLDLDKLERDVAARELLVVRFARIKRIHDKMHATMLLLGADFYQGALAIYRALKANGREAGLTTLLAELGVTFAGQGKKTTSQVPKPEPDSTQS